MVLTEAKMSHTVSGGAGDHGGYAELGASMFGYEIYYLASMGP